MEDRMAPRAYWKGSLKLSLVTCPIALCPASTQAEKTHFHQINTKTGHRLKQQMVDERTGRVVDKDHRERDTSFRRDGTWKSTNKSLRRSSWKVRTPWRSMISFPPKTSMNGISTSHTISCRTERQARTPSLSSVMQ